MTGDVFLTLDEFEDKVIKQAIAENYSPVAIDPMLKDLYGTRPGVDVVEMINATAARPMMELAAYFEANVSIFADMVQTIVQEVLRKGVEWKERFAQKCMLCDFESKEDVDKCPNCGSEHLRAPNKSELQLFSRLDGTTFIDRANENGQTLLEVLAMDVHNTVVFDRPYVLLIKAYVTKEDGTVDAAYVREFLSIDPRFIVPIFDRSSGRWGDGRKVCLEHRDSTVTADICSICGKRTYPITFQSTAVNNPRYFIAGEIVTGSLYYPGLVSGFPIALKMADELFTYLFLTKQTRVYYEKGRPPGLLAVRSNNPQSAYEFWTKVQAKMREDSSYTPMIASDSGTAGGKLVDFVSLIQDPNTYRLATKDDVRQRVGSMLGVSIIYQGDTSNSGGLKNDQNLFRVTRYTTQRHKRFLDDKILRPIVRAFGIVDHDLVIKEDDDEDRANRIEIELKEAELAEKMLGVGIGAEYENGKWTFDSGPAKKPAQEQPGIFPPANPFSPAPKAPEELEDDDIDEGVGKSAEMTDEEFCDSLVSKAFFKTRRQRLLEALAKSQRMSSFKHLSPQEAEEAYGKLIDVMSKDKWTVKEASNALQHAYPDLPDANAEAIARTESMVIAGTARELDFKENNPPDARYKWQGPDDKRTTETCREAVKGSVDGMQLDELKAYLHQVAEAHGQKPRDWVLHPNERHRVVRKI
jgi:predicted Zn-ribbon and HTH transcriptional regulator